MRRRGRTQEVGPGGLGFAGIVQEIGGEELLYGHYTGRFFLFSFLEQQETFLSGERISDGEKPCEFHEREKRLHTIFMRCKLHGDRPHREPFLLRRDWITHVDFGNLCDPLLILKLLPEISEITMSDPIPAQEEGLSVRSVSMKFAA